MIIVAAVIVFWLQFRDRQALQAENTSLQQKISQLTAESTDFSNRLAAATDSGKLSDDQQNELLRLRGEIASLRQKNNQLATVQQRQSVVPHTALSAQTPGQLTPQDQFELTRVHTVNGLKQIELAAKIYAGEHNEQYPTNFEQLKNELGGKTDFDGIPLTDFEFVNTGAANDSTPDVVNFRTGQPLPNPQGGWVMIYGLGDGSVQTVYGDTSDSQRFTDFERQHSPPPQ